MSSRQSLWRETKSTASSKWPCNTSPTKNIRFENDKQKEHELDQSFMLKSTFYKIFLPENDQPLRKNNQWSSVQKKNTVTEKQQVRVSPVKLRTQEQSVV